MNDPFDLARFVQAQEPVHARAAGADRDLFEGALDKRFASTEDPLTLELLTWVCGISG